jgi:hypothetical protein
MATAEIKSTDWEPFCQKFLELHQNSLVTLTTIDQGGLRVEAAREMPLRKIWFEKGACNDSIFINLEQQGKREINHEVVGPIHLKLREEGEGKKALQIDGENGSTLLSFHSGRMNELMQMLSRE